MGQIKKSKKFPILLAVVVGVISIALSIFSIPESTKSLAQHILIGIFISGIIGWSSDNKKVAIIAYIILWGAVISAIVID